MKQHSEPVNEETISMKIPEGYLLLLSTETFFDVDLLRINLAMNGIDVQWWYPDLMQQPAERPSIFVRPEQQEQALAVIASLDLTDFTLSHGK